MQGMPQGSAPERLPRQNTSGAVSVERPQATGRVPLSERMLAESYAEMKAPAAATRARKSPPQGGRGGRRRPPWNLVVM